MTCQLSRLDTVEKDPRNIGWNKGGLGIGEGGEKMTLTTVDSLEWPGLDFIKIDVEGAEGLVIRGGHEPREPSKHVVCVEHNHQRIEPSVVGPDPAQNPFAELATLGRHKCDYCDWQTYVTPP